jgi:predicted RNase H-like HicB family nuclease
MNTIEVVGASQVAASYQGRIISMRWQQQSPPLHEFAAIACPEEEDGGFSVFALHYPGVVSQGETIEEAQANIAEAFLAILESSRKHGRSMEYSFSPVVDAALRCVRFRVTVNG